MSKEIVYVPVTPGGTLCMWLAAKTEDKAWEKLLKDAAHMPYKGKEGFKQRGYKVVTVEAFYLMNKQEALTRLAKLLEIIDALLEIIDAPDPVKALLETVKPGSRVTYWVPNWNREVPLKCEANAEEPCELYDLAFVTEKQAADYRKAFATMVALRRQPGTEPPIESKVQVIVEPISGMITYDNYCSFRDKVSKLSPCFDSKETAKAAIATIGEDRIVHMYKTLQGID